MASQWRVGRTWTVEYFTTIPSSATISTPKPPKPQHSIWLYEVTRKSDSSAIISVANEGGNRQYEIEFLLPGPLLRRVRMTSGAFPDTVIDNPSLEGFTGWSLQHSIIFDWPHPSLVSRTKREYYASAGEVLQTSTDKDGLLQTTMTYTDLRSDELLEVRQVTQTWSATNPWWLEASIEAEYIFGGEKLKELLIEGKVVR